MTPQNNDEYFKRTLCLSLALLISLALAIPGCGGKKTDVSSNATENEPKNAVPSAEKNAASQNGASDESSEAKIDNGAEDAIEIEASDDKSSETNDTNNEAVSSASGDVETTEVQSNSSSKDEIELEANDVESSDANEGGVSTSSGDDAPVVGGVTGSGGVTGAHGFIPPTAPGAEPGPNPEPGPIVITPPGPKDYSLADAINEIQFVTDSGNGYPITLRARVNHLQETSNQIQRQCQLARIAIQGVYEAQNSEEYEGVEMLMPGLISGMLNMGISRSTNEILASLNSYLEELNELPETIEWKNEYIEKNKQAWRLCAYCLIKINLNVAYNSMLHYDSDDFDPESIKNFLTGDPSYLKDLGFEDTLCCKAYQKVLLDFNDLITDSDIKSRFPVVTLEGFLNELKPVYDKYDVEFTAKAASTAHYVDTTTISSGDEFVVKFKDVEIPFIWVSLGDGKGYFIMETPFTREMFSAVIASYLEGKDEELKKKTEFRIADLNEEIQRRIDEGELGEQAKKYQMMNSKYDDRFAEDIMPMIVEAFNQNKEAELHGFEYAIPSGYADYRDQKNFHDKFQYCDYLELCIKRDYNGKESLGTLDYPSLIDEDKDSSRGERPAMLRLVLKPKSKD